MGRCYSRNITASCVAFPAGKREYPRGNGKTRKERKRTMWDLNDLLDKLEEIRDTFESEG